MEHEAMAEPLGRRQSRPAASDTPLIVDMDGALLRTDVLFEGLAHAFFREPLATLAAFRLLFQGRAQFKRRIAEISDLDPSLLPMREEFVLHLQSERDRGREIHLYTAADHSIAVQVAERVGLFHSVQGTSGDVNLKGKNKLAEIQQRFPGGFTYAGDSHADMPIWQGAETIVLAGAAGSVAKRARALGKPVEAEFRPSGSPMSWLRALRVHQWTKNLLIYFPLLLSPLSFNTHALMATGLGFVILGFVASACYLVNDMADLAADRRHRSKRDRPLASGQLPIQHAAIVAPLMIIAGVIAAFLLSPPFAVGLLFYIATTLSYSLRLKRIALLDVFLLGLLYTLRLIMGTLLIGMAPSAWLLTFSMFFFTAMSLAKRHAELMNAQSGVERRIAGRGYLTTDAPLTLSLGISLTTASNLILVLYMVEEAFPSGLYVSPEWLWAAPLLVSLWTMRIWLLAHRGELDDDPVAFAIRDRISLALGAILALAFLVARL
jgi:4-hydroxybenzoate polyprenyltransferase